METLIKDFPSDSKVSSHQLYDCLFDSGSKRVKRHLKRAWRSVLIGKISNRVRLICNRCQARENVHSPLQRIRLQAKYQPGTVESRFLEPLRQTKIGLRNHRKFEISKWHRLKSNPSETKFRVREIWIPHYSSLRFSNTLFRYCIKVVHIYPLCFVVDEIQWIRVVSHNQWKRKSKKYIYITILLKGYCQHCPRLIYHAVMIWPGAGFKPVLSSSNRKEQIASGKRKEIFT